MCSSPGVYPRSWPPRCWAGAPELSGRSWTRAPETQSHWWPGRSCGGSGPEGGTRTRVSEDAAHSWDKHSICCLRRWRCKIQFTICRYSKVSFPSDLGSKNRGGGGVIEDPVTVPGTWLLLGWAQSLPGTGRWSSPGRRAHPAAAGAASCSGRCSALWLGPAPETCPAPAPCRAGGDKEGHVSKVIALTHTGWNEPQTNNKLMFSTCY